MKIDRRFVKKDNHIVIKQVILDTKLTSKDVLDNINQFDQNIEKTHTNITKAKAQVDLFVGDLKEFEEKAKGIGKFREWATKIQESKVKVYVAELMEAKKLIVEELNKEKDPTLTAEQINKQKYMQLQREIAIDKKVAKEINAKIIQDKLFNNCIFENPWK